MIPTYPVILEQNEGDNRRRVEIDRSSLPEDAFVREVNLLFTRVDYPGRRVPTFHILGIKDEPITFAGLFSDAEEGVAFFADAARDAIEGMHRDAKSCRLIYRSFACQCFIKRTKFTEINLGEIRYEIELEIIGPTSVKPPVVIGRDAFAFVNDVARAVAAADVVYETLPEEIRIAPPEWVPDPWLETRLLVEEAHEKVRTLLELVGNNKALDLDDRIVSGARAACTTVNLARSAVEEAETGGVFGLADALTRSRMVYGMQTSLDSIGLACNL